MEIQMNGMANREISLNRQNTDQDILLKTLEKTEEIKQRQKAGEPQTVDRVRDGKQGRIDLYA